MVMISTASSYDKYEEEQRKKEYIKIIKNGFDILETDRPEEVYETIKFLYPELSKKYKNIDNIKGNI